MRVLTQLLVFTLGSGLLCVKGSSLGVSDPARLKDAPKDAAQGPSTLGDPEGFVSAEAHAAAFEDYLTSHPYDCPDLASVYNKARLYALLFTTLRHCSALDFLYMTAPGDEGVDPIMVGEENMKLGSQLLKEVVDVERAACQASCKTSFFSVATLVYVAIYIAVRVLACATAPART